MFVVILLSVGFTVCISLLFSVGFLFMSPEVTWMVFCSSLAFQWIVMHPINRILSARSARLELKKLDKIEKLQKLELKQITALECAYCGTPNGVHIQVNADNEFNCNKCGNTNNIVMQFTTTRITDPLLTDINASKTDMYDELGDIMKEDDDAELDKPIA